jgi:phosphatidylserine/phosphatidylglycerophosphate/cardiolipin synthase-like enzyme
MKKLSFVVCFTLSLFAHDLTLNNTPTQVYFSPKGGVTEAIVKELGHAKTEVLIQAYSFTSAPISKALLDAAHRGVKVVAVLDKSNIRAKYTAADALAKRGVPVYIDAKHQIAHNKIIIIDRETVITGSFNFSKAAEETNAENLLVLKNKQLAEVYLKNFAEHREHSGGYVGK